MHWLVHTAQAGEIQFRRIWRSGRIAIGCVWKSALRWVCSIRSTRFCALWAAYKILFYTLSTHTHIVQVCLLMFVCALHASCSRQRRRRRERAVCCFLFGVVAVFHIIISKTLSQPANVNCRATVYRQQSSHTHRGSRRFLTSI